LTTPKFAKKLGYLPSGNDHPTLTGREISVQKAEELCAEDPLCKGFTFNSDAPKHHDNSLVAMMFFKTEAAKATNADGWFTCVLLPCFPHNLN
jgi:hypothetical protein